MTEVAAEHCGPTEMCVSSGEGFRERCHLSWIVKEESELPGKAREGSAESTEVTKHVLSAFSFREVWWLRNRKYMWEGWDMRPEKRAAAMSQGKASVSGRGVCLHHLLVEDYISSINASKMTPKFGSLKYQQTFVISQFLRVGNLGVTWLGGSSSGFVTRL